jgi:hypothetical protein
MSLSLPQALTSTSLRTLTPGPSPKGRGELAWQRLLFLLALGAVICAGCTKQSSPVSSPPVKDPTEEERMLSSTTWIADSMLVNGENAVLFYANFIRGNDTALVDYNYVGCTFSFLLNYKVWFRSVTTLPWLDFYYPEKALEDWTLTNGMITIQFPYARPLQEAVWNIDERTQATLVLRRNAGKDTITLFCSAGDTDQDWSQRMNAVLSRLLYKTWTLDSVSKRQLALADSLKTIRFSGFQNGVGFADVTYRNGGTFRDISHASMNASMFDDIPEFGLHLKYMPLPEAAYTYFHLTRLGERRMELIEEATKTRFIFTSGQ